MAVVKLTSVIDRAQATDESMLVLLEKQREAFFRDGAPSYERRRESLQKLRQQIVKYKQEICEAISEDFGNRSHHESMLAEIAITIASFKHTQSHLKKWMKDKSAPIALQYKPARGKIHYQPLGVTGIISPWNYPFQLAIVPVMQALSAGNRVMLKPSELTPKTSALMAKMLGEIFDEDEVAVVTGGPEVGAAFTTLPFDFLFYTGSTKVGRLVMKAAAENLVPVALELGGKSPCIVGEDCAIDKAVPTIMTGKLLNAGQTCVAPDYVFVHESKVDEFVAVAQAQAEKMYPTLSDNVQYTSIVSDAHYDRITRLVDDAVEKGARVVVVNPNNEDLAKNRKIAPTFVLDVTDDMDIMQEEIFGPVMPVKTYTKESEAIDYINKHPRPLALYYYGHDTQKREEVVQKTTAGGMCCNDTLFHLAQEELPFGGVGPSGVGAYHGKKGFETFSHAKSVFYQTRFSSAGLLRAPYGKIFDTVVKVLIGK